MCSLIRNLDIEDFTKNLTNYESPSNPQRYPNYLVRLQNLYKTKYLSSDYARKAQLQNGEQPIILKKSDILRINKYYATKGKTEYLANIYSGIEYDESKLKLEEKIWKKIQKEQGFSLDHLKKLLETMKQIHEKNIDMSDVLLEDPTDKEFSYICPAAWCYTCELPFLISDLNLVGEKIQCPVCHNDTILIRNYKLSLKSYPKTFQGDDVHTWVKCLSRIKSDTKRESDSEYIFTSSPANMTPHERFMYLPDQLHKLINLTQKKKNIYCRFGILPMNQQQEYYLTFEHTLCFLLEKQIDTRLKEDEGEDTSDFRAKLVKLLKQTPNIQDIFRICRRGSLYLFFDANITNLYAYIEKALSLHPSIILALLGYPMVLAPEGINFVIFTNTGTAFECEFVNYPKGKNVLMYKFYLGGGEEADVEAEVEAAAKVQDQIKIKNFKIIYEPIITNTKNFQTGPYTNDSMSHKQVEQIINLKFNGTHCTETQDLKLKKGVALPQIQKIDFVALQNGTMVVLGQHVNAYNQTEGLVILFKEKVFYFPIQPVPIKTELPIWEYSQVSLQNLLDTLDFLIAMNLPSEKIQIDTEHQRLYLADTQLFVPLLKAPQEDFLTNVLKSGLEQASLLDGDTSVKYVVNARLKYKQNVNLIELGFKKFMYELSQVVSKNKDYQEKIKIYISNYEKHETVRKNFTRNRLISYLQNKETLPSPNEEKFKDFDLFVRGTIGEYVEQDLLQQCAGAEAKGCNEQNMCQYNDETKKCKMVIPHENYDYFFQRLATQLLVNKTLQNDFFTGFQSMTLPKPTGETIFYSSNEFAKYLQTEDFYDNKSLIQTPSLQHFDYTNPTF